jgi:predicted ATP-dependent serine protease
VLSEALGGLVLGSTVIVGGLQGAGKSTLCAELAAVMARDLEGLAYWLDAEMTRALLADVFRRTGSPLDRIRRIARRPDPEEPTPRPIGWRDALRAVPADAVVVVVDSIQRWAHGYKEQTALLDAIAKLSPTVLAISHSTKRGEIAGPNAHQHDGDAVVTVKTTEIVATKSRWVPTPRIVQRAASSPSKNSASSK